MNVLVGFAYLVGTFHNIICINHDLNSRYHIFVTFKMCELRFVLFC